MKKDTFIFYLEWLRTMEAAQLTNAERSRLIDAIVSYADTGTAPALPRLLMAIFSPIRTTIDKDAEKYAKIVAVNRENGARGGRPKGAEKPKKTQNNPVCFSGFSEKTEKTQSPHYDNEYDYDNDYVFVDDAQKGAPGEEEKKRIFEIFFWRNIKDVAGEQQKFIAYNEQRKWKALDTPAKRQAAALQWTPQETAPRCKREFLTQWQAMYMRLRKEQPQVAEAMIDVNSKCLFDQSGAKIICKKVVRDYIEKERPAEMLNYIGTFRLTTSES